MVAATVIGLGSIGLRRARILRELGCDVSYMDTRNVTNEFPRVTGPRGDVVFVCTPPHLRREAYEQSLGVPLFIEKPLCLPGTVPEDLCRRVLEDAYVAENLAHCPGVMTALKVKAFTRELVYLSDLREWRGGRTSYNEQIPYSIALDSHELNLMIMAHGKPNYVTARFEGPSAFSSHHDVLIGLRWVEDGMVATIRNSYIGPYLRAYTTGGKTIIISRKDAEETYRLEVEKFLLWERTESDWPLVALGVFEATIKSHKESGRCIEF